MKGRRQFLLGLGMGAIGVGVPLAAYFNFHHLWRRVVGLLPDPAPSGEPLGGRVVRLFGFSAQDLDRADWSRFARGSFSKQTLRLWQMMKDRELKEFLSASIKRDYYEGKVIEADGWILSETEVYLYNLAASAKK
jgi:hypothetical protein